MDSPAAAPSPWLELCIQADREAVEALSEVLSQFGFDHGIAIDEPFVQDRDGDNLQIDLSKPVRLRTWVESGSFDEVQRARLEHALWHVGVIRPVGPLQVSPVRESDWSESWKEHFRPVRVGRRVVVRPPWFEYEPGDGDVVVQIDPGMAFGAGTHPTTRLAMQAVEQEMRPGDCVLDVGAGSAILSIAAARLGAVSVDAIEIDAAAARQGQLNVETNDLAGTVTLVTGSFDQHSAFADQQYDLTVANIIARILIELSPSLAASVRVDGVLIVSGIIDEKEESVLNAFAQLELQSTQRIQEEDWVCHVLRRSC